jgi:hypothetical protein
LQVKSSVWLFCSLRYKNENSQYEGRRTQGNQIIGHVDASNSYLFM